jgi:hypothetical protein
VRLDVVADVGGVADEGAALEVGDFLGEAVLDDEPDVVAGDGCALVLVCEAGDVEGGGGVDVLGVEQQLEVITPFELDPLTRFHQPVHHLLLYADDYLDINRPSFKIYAGVMPFEDGMKRSPK